MIERVSWDHVHDLIPWVKLQLALHLNQMRHVNFLLAHGQDNEREGLHPLLQPDVLYVLDRGYFVVALCRDMLRAQSDFVMCIYNNVQLAEILEVLPVTLPPAPRDLYINLQDHKAPLQACRCG